MNFFLIFLPLNSILYHSGSLFFQLTNLFERSVFSFFIADFSTGYTFYGEQKRTTMLKMEILGQAQALLGENYFFVNFFHLAGKIHGLIFP